MMMSWWVYAKQFPKYALVAGIILGSTALFLGWWLFRTRPKTPAERQSDAEQSAAIARNAAKAEARIDYLFLADDDLYDAGTGELLFKRWLRGDHPTRLYYDAKSKRILGEYPEGFARYTFDGKREATMMRSPPPAVVPGTKKIVFVQKGDIWQADIDWQNFRFTNERQVTSMGVFYEPHFSENVVLLTDKTLIVRNLNDLLRVNLADGKVKPGRLNLRDIASRRSPDSRWVVGSEGGAFYCYDVDADSAQTIPIGRAGISAFLWLGADKCIGLANGKSIVTYDRPAHTLTETVALPFPCFKLGEPSPTGRYLFAVGGMNGRDAALVDLEKKTAERVNGGAGITWVSDDTFAFSRDVADSDLRGTWMSKADGVEREIMKDPTNMEGREGDMPVLQRCGLILFLHSSGISKTNLDGSDLEILNLPAKARFSWKVVRTL